MPRAYSNSKGIFKLIKVLRDSRYEPHKKLKRFLSPAFTVNYIDNLESFFQHTVRALLSKYQNEIDHNLQLAKRTGFQVDLMDDLHNVALDM